ncbi:MAG TPA: DUF4838 domain-containing protein [Clostridiales bacterium]|nr:MAG: hypothetical protein BWY37_01770 [Firmicutes bacterium ADurb.Bin262]HOU10797.1 DUF4838 domain-containing protein [Clostridiales bacterium]HQK74024.1 DUF4838 domain-containing protein [Clostridiales bacterium]
MTIVKFICSVLAMLQFAGMTLNIIPFPKDVDYGGTAYVEPQVSEWLTLIENGTSRYSIVRGAGAGPSEVTAANELQKYLEQISGVRLVVRTDAAFPSPGEIIVGKTNREETGTYTIDRKALGDEGFRLLVSGQRLIIAGGELRGTLYGVYTFLEEQLGCRWFTDDVTTIPRTSVVKINAHLDDTQIPAFEARHLNGDASEAWQVKQKGNVHVNTPAWGGGYNNVTWDVSLDKLVPDSLFDEHPEYFAYREDTGERTTAHVCLSNPGALQTAVANARKLIQNAAPGQNILHVGQKDNQDYCQCPACKALYEQYGAVSATMVLFTNALSDALSQEFPAVTYTFYAYLECEAPPVNLKCNANVTPVLCPIHACYAHPVNQCGHLDGEQYETFSYRFGNPEPAYVDIVEGWGKSAEKIYIYNYTVNFLNYLQFAANLQTFAPNFKYYSENKVAGIYYNCGGGHNIAAFNQLRNYVKAKTMWDPDCDVERHINEFLAAYYGEAAPYIKDYLDYITAKVMATTHSFVMEWHYQTALLTNAEVAKLDRLWDKAEAASLTPEQRFRVETARLSFRYNKANTFRGEFSILNPYRGKLNEQLYDDLKAHGISMICAFSPMPPKEEINFFLTAPVDWR